MVKRKRTDNSMVKIKGRQLNEDTTEVIRNRKSKDRQLNEDTTEVIRNRKSKDRQLNGQKKKDRQLNGQDTTEIIRNVNQRTDNSMVKIPQR